MEENNAVIDDFSKAKLSGFELKSKTWFLQSGQNLIFQNFAWTTKTKDFCAKSRFLHLVF